MREQQPVTNPMIGSELYAVEGGLTVLCKDPVVIWSSSMKDRSPVRMLDTVHMGFHDSCNVAARHI